MNEQQRPTGAADEPDSDPTADFLAGVRPQETPWRRERPVDPVEPQAGEAIDERSSRSQTFAKAARRAAPYIQGAAVAGWVASAALNERYEDGYETGYDTGFDAGLDAGGGS